MWHTNRDNNKFCAAVFTILLKAFDCICRNFLIAKLSSYALDPNAGKLISVINHKNLE